MLYDNIHIYIHDIHTVNTLNCVVAKHNVHYMLYTVTHP